MAHVRAQLRDAAVTALKSCPTTGATHVYPSRVYVLATGDLPGLRVYSNADTIEAIGIMEPQQYQRDTELMVECCAVANDALDAALDQIMLEVEEALASPLAVSGKEVRLLLTAVEIEMDAEAAQPQGLARLTFNATLFHGADSPDVLM